jgi:hypothetical protein
MLPQFAALDQPSTPQAQFAHGAILGGLNAEETQEWRVGMAQAVADGTYFNCAAISLRRQNKARDARVNAGS